MIMKYSLLYLGDSFIDNFFMSYVMMNLVDIARIVLYLVEVENTLVDLYNRPSQRQ